MTGRPTCKVVRLGGVDVTVYWSAELGRYVTCPERDDDASPVGDAP